jgi:hypothetical protein
MSADRELLELAARATGYKYKPANECIVIDGIPGRWNPLTDDGDALRLAVKLGIEPSWHVTLGYAVALYKSGFYRIEEYSTDGLSATRRAIVRAAAEIGMGSPS